MADPVQQAAGGEQIQAPVVDVAPPSIQEVVATPEEKLPTTLLLKTEPPTVEPPIAEPLKTEPPTAEPLKIETPIAEPLKIETPIAEPVKTETPTAEPVKTETPTAEPLKTEPLTAESPNIKPTTTEPPNTEQVKKEEPEAVVETAQAVSENLEVLPTPVTNAESKLLLQKTKNIKQEVAAPEPEQNNDIQNSKEEEVKADPIVIAPVLESSDKDEKNNETPQETEDWQKRESELLKKIEELEKVKNARSEEGLRLELKVREEEIDLLKARVKNLETELQAALSKPGGKNHEMIQNIKQQHEELLSKARGMIFDKTKMVKNQELQIEALTTQVQSLKDINLITKDLLEIRNSEVKAMEERFQAMEARFKAEKERYDLVLKRAQTSTNINDDLRKEYETQLAIFKELREKYEQRVQALVAENNRLKEAVKGPGTSE